jgi:ATP phosphoribosyltransferase regulatory subunit
MFRRSLLEIPSGVQCFLGEEARLRREIERVAVEVFRGWSYEEIVLPLFDFDDVFTRGGGRADGAYRFIGRDGDVMALRYDFTALVAKMVVSRLSRREIPLRLFYSGEVLRYQPPRAGRREELFQVGLEHLGAGGVDSDVEVILVAEEALSRLGIGDAIFTLGHAGFARDLFEPAELMGGREVLDRARRVGGEGEALSRLESVISKLEELGFGSRIRLDLGEVRDFDYYTGLVFEIHAEGSGLELGGGGRYDSLLGRFGREMPAVGFYLSLDRVAELLSKRGGSALEDEAEPVSSVSEAIEARRRGNTVRIRS